MCHKPLTSVIVPIFNTERYLNHCICSLLNQTFTNFELILVDDGSTDKSGDICDDFAKKDPRIIIIHKKNSGVSDSRNKGIDISKGKYIMFCDSDDIVHPQWIEMHINTLECNYNSLIVSNIACFWDDLLHEFSNVKPYFTPIDYYSLFTEGLSGYPVNKIFRKDIIVAHNIRFDRNLPIGEDVTFVASYLKYCEGCIKLHNTLYYYRQLGNSAVHRYNPNLLGYMQNAFYVRIPFIDEQSLPKYCDHWLCEFIHLLKNAHDIRNKNMSWFEQMKYNQKCLTSTEMKMCLRYATGKNENRTAMMLLKSKTYFFYYIFSKFISFRYFIISKFN